MALKVTVKGASQLPNVELLGKSDPYTLVAFRGWWKHFKNSYVHTYLVVLTQTYRVMHRKDFADKVHWQLSGSTMERNIGISTEAAATHH